MVDRLFSRVGAADDLARGRSTFMVEMTETAAILNQAGPRALVVVDEIGRGTATLDGLAIAWAVLEALHGQVAAAPSSPPISTSWRGLAARCPACARTPCGSRNGAASVVFLHEVAEGAAGRSWGVHVARLAGVPAAAVRRAAALLAALERRPRRRPTCRCSPARRRRPRRIRLRGASTALEPDRCPRARRSTRSTAEGIARGSGSETGQTDGHGQRT